MKKIYVLMVAAAVLSSAARADQSVDETRPVSADSRIEIEIISGGLEIVGWDRNEVRIRGTLGDDVDGLEVSGNETSLSIGLDIEDEWGRHHRDIDARLEISIPQRASVQAETVSADISAQQLAGVAELQSVSGTIRITGGLERAEVESVSGDIEVEGGQTSISAETVNGEITLRGASGHVEAASVSGDMSITADAIDRASFESVSGNVEFSGSLAAEARFDVEVHSGNIAVALPAVTDASFEIETWSGSIRNELGPEAERAEGPVPSKWLKFSTGNGSARVTIETFSGNVQLLKR